MYPKILLVNLASRNNGMYINTLPPLGILGIASYLEKNSIPVDIFDANIEKNIINYGCYDIVGFSINMSNIATTLDTIKSVKESFSHIKIVAGGPSCISNPSFFSKRTDIDEVCAGEGEEAFKNYILQKAYTKTKNSECISLDGSLKYFPGERNEHIDNLDNLPFPALNKVNIKKYQVPISKSRPISSIITSRGCPHSCIFCFHSMGRIWRARSASNVVNEMEWQVKELGVKEICIQDDNFSLDINRAKQIFDLVIKRRIKLKIQFQNGIRVDNIDYELLKIMKDAGVWMVGVAPETGSKEILNKVNKSIDLDKGKKNCRLVQNIKHKDLRVFHDGFSVRNLVGYAKDRRIRKRAGHRPDTCFKSAGFPKNQAL